MKLWQKKIQSLKEVEAFTVGNDREFDLQLAPFDVLGSIAHVTMLETVGLLEKPEKEKLITELRSIYHQVQHPGSEFSIDESVEDIHSQVEMMLTKKLGDTGKKIHSARSRNDQVFVDLKLFLRSELETIVNSVHLLFDLLQQQSEKHKSTLLPGYTHLQLAMPSSFGLWFGAYAESLVDDTITLKAAYDVINKNPLGSAAGYGSSFPINRTLTTELLGFDDLNYNVVYAQMGRGKAERICAQSLANVADTLSRFSMDATLYLNQNFGFISFPAELTTGSSIMPHKKNPDVFEIIRAHCNRIKTLPNEIMMMTTNLPSGYHRDLQLLKEHLFPAFSTLKNCIEMAGLMISNIEVKENILADEKYKYLFTVDAVNELVMQGTPFRDAYKIIGQQVEENLFEKPVTDHAGKGGHEGSIYNLCNLEINQQMQKLINSFPFASVHQAIEKLVGLHSS
ncbi:MAG: argininosuccinate lyase [Chitinophagaceae bacterium]|jgi:argininosuccinate lyase|nr:argininosuccinate lyase [Chitinophagaceae bacterium]